VRWIVRNEVGDRPWKSERSDAVEHGRNEDDEGEVAPIDRAKHSGRYDTRAYEGYLPDCCRGERPDDRSGCGNGEPPSPLSPAEGADLRVVVGWDLGCHFRVGSLAADASVVGGRADSHCTGRPLSEVGAWVRGARAGLLRREREERLPHCARRVALV